MSQNDPSKVPAPLSTPDPSATTEVIVAYITALLGNIFVIFGTSLTDAQQLAIQGLFTGSILLGTLLYSAYVRGSRAKAGGVVGGFLLDVPTPDHDDSTLGK